MKKSLVALFALALLSLSGCAKAPDQTNPLSAHPTAMPQSLLHLEVTGYPNGSPMPAKFATQQGGGENVSIGLRWQPVPAAQSYALLFDDHAPVARNWVHWLVVDIPNTATAIPEGASRSPQMPEGSRELTTSWKRTGYDGPQPPVGSGSHEYVATLFAMDTATLNLPENPTRAEFMNAVEKHSITQESWSGTYERK
jgi:Raf kinase inhibitor-like YbhB/YbcL family protein